MLNTRQCLQPWDSINVTADGDVYPCCVVSPQLKVGTLKNNSLLEILNATESVTIKRKLLTGDIADLPCHECCNAQFGPVEDFKKQVSAMLASSKRR